MDAYLKLETTNLQNIDAIIYDLYLYFNICHHNFIILIRKQYFHN